MMLTFTLNDSIICIQYYIMNTVSTGKVSCACRYVWMCVRTRESAFSWCLKKSSMVHDDCTSSRLDAVSKLSLSVSDRVVCLLNHHSIHCKSKVHLNTIVLKLNSFKTSTCCSNVRITLLLNGSQKKCRPYSVSPAGRIRLY